MCTGIALAYSELPMELIRQHKLDLRVHERGGEKGIRFLARHTERALPIWHEGQLRIVRWGCRRNQSKVLPCTAWTWSETIEAGGVVQLARRVC
jgi:hypothetical protein